MKVHDNLAREESTLDQYTYSQLLPTKDSIVDEKINIVEKMADIDQEMGPKDESSDALELSSILNLSTKNNMKSTEKIMNRTTKIDNLFSPEKASTSAKTSKDAFLLQTC